MDDARALAGVRVKPLEWSWQPPYHLSRGHFAYSIDVGDDGAVVRGLLKSDYAMFRDVAAAKAAAQADYEARILSAIDRLAAPEGVGLTRYEPRSIRDSAGFGFGGQRMVADPEGEWVRHEDAAAALAAEKERGDEAEARLATVVYPGSTWVTAERHREMENMAEDLGAKLFAAEAERDALKAALALAATRLEILTGRMRACHEETGKHDLLDEAEAFCTETRAALSKTQGGG